MSDHTLHVFNDASSLALEHLGAAFDPSVRGYQQVYLLTITTINWQYLNNDIRSHVHADIDIDGQLFDTLEILLDGLYVDDLPDYVMEWVETNRDELCELVEELS